MINENKLVNINTQTKSNVTREGTPKTYKSYTPWCVMPQMF